MTDNLLFSSAELSFVLHATEDAKKIILAIEKILGKSPTGWSSSRTQGHFGNSITNFKTTVAEKGADRIALALASAFNGSDKTTLLQSLEARIDEKGNLYLRLDKQRLCKNIIGLSDTDPVRFRFKPSTRAILSEYLRFYRGFFSSTE